MAGNISIILYAILSFGLYQLIRKKNNIFYLSVSLVSLAKFPFMIFFFLPLFLYGYKEFKRITFFFFLVLLIYYFQYYFDKELFMSFINSTKTYKSDNFLLIHGTGIGIHGNIDLLQNLIFSKSDIELFKPSGYFSFLLHLFISLILFLSAFFLFPRTKKMNYKQIKLLVSFYIQIVQIYHFRQNGSTKKWEAHVWGSLRFFREQMVIQTNEKKFRECRQKNENSALNTFNFHWYFFTNKW